MFDLLLIDNIDLAGDATLHEHLQHVSSGHRYVGKWQTWHETISQGYQAEEYGPMCLEFGFHGENELQWAFQWRRWLAVRSRCWDVSDGSTRSIRPLTDCNQRPSHLRSAERNNDLLWNVVCCIKRMKSRSRKSWFLSTRRNAPSPIWNEAPLPAAEDETPSMDKSLP